MLVFYPPDVDGTDFEVPSLIITANASRIPGGPVTIG
jgi:hypothetical protein